jgi:hypothetical protein
MEKPHYNTDLSIIGKKFNKLTVLEYSHSKRTAKRNSQAMFKCKCDCGNEVIVAGSNVRLEHTKSCGCYLPEWIKKTKTSHGQSNTRLYDIWQGIKRRCYNKNETVYKYYGGKGIIMNEKWLDFTKFMEWATSNGYTDKLTIERNDVNGNYEPNNCRWVTMKEQAANTTRSHNLTAFGETKIIQYWADAIGTSTSVILARLRRGWNIEDAVSLPPDMNRKRPKRK